MTSPELVTKEEFRTEIGTLRDEFRGGIGGLRDEIRHLSGRMDRMQLTLVAGFLSMIVALIVSVGV
ncbi:MAG: hypothetical protein ABWZ58_02955 [Acidimicrobiia bacterium]